METDVLIIGAGLSGAVMADQFARKLNKKVIILEKRNHVAGNCYDYIDAETGILVSEYGPHFFHTNNEEVWQYINQFSGWYRYDPKILSKVDDRVVPVPVNMETINVLCNQNLKSETETEEWLKTVQVPCENPQNSKDIGLSRVGEKLYESMFKPYTKKQWTKYPEELDPSVLSRIPVRNNNDTRYFSDKYQVLPEYGYTHFVENILSHPNITVQLNTNFDIETTTIKYKTLIYTGPIDSYFKHLPKLEYRSLKFEKEVIKNYGFFQQNLVVNYPSEDVPYTRIVEYKHLPNNESNHTIIVKEYPSSEGEPYYPIPNETNKNLYKQYQKLAENENNVHMIGRLANYKYFNMDEAIANALTYFNEHFLNSNNSQIVVAHYNEDVSWLNQYQGNNLHVYSKGNPPRINCTLHILPNIGRESHTYLRYIVENYDNLPDVVFFTQGSIREHYSQDISYFLNLKPNQLCSENYDSSKYFSYYLTDYRITNWANCNLEQCEFPGDVWFNKFIDSEVDIRNSPINIYWAAIFSVRKEAILSRPKDFYKMLECQHKTNNTELSHFMERSWYYIFNLHKKSLNIKKSVLAVIARYREDVSWVSKLKIPYLIINKGDPIDNPNCVCIPNSVNGREGHSYIWYILQHYDNLPDSVIFLQGDPFEHQEKLIEFLEPEIIEKMPSFQPLTSRFNDHLPPKELKNIYGKKFEGFDYSILHFDEDVLDIYPSYYDEGLAAIIHYTGIVLNTNCSRKELHKFFEVPYKENCMTPYFFSAMFKIDKELIRKYSKDYYTRIFNILDTHLVYVYMCERMWYAMYVEANVPIPDYK